jgi:hypothetical protein
MRDFFLSRLIGRDWYIWIQQRPPSEIDFMRQKTKPDITTVKAEQSHWEKRITNTWDTYNGNRILNGFNTLC